MSSSFVFVLLLQAAVSVLAQVPSGVTAANPGELQTSFEVRFLEFDNVYLDVTPGTVLTKGMKLLVKRRSRDGNSGVIAELRVKIVSPSSAVCEVLSMRENVRAGDIASLTSEELAALQKPRSPGSAIGGERTLAAKALPQTQSSATTGPTSSTVAKGGIENKAASSGGKPQTLASVPVVSVAKIAQESTRPSADTNVEMASAVNAAAPSSTTQAKPPVVSAVNASSQSSAMPVVGQTNMRPISVTAAPTQTSAAAPASESAQVSTSQRSVTLGDSKAAVAVSKDEQQANLPADESVPQQVADNSAQQPSPDLKTIFKIKFVAQDTVYLSAGTATGLTSGMKLIVKHSESDITEKGTLAKASQAPTIAELTVISVASSSAVCDVNSKTSEIQPGDLAFMDQATAETLAEKQALSATRKYPQVVSFSGGDPLEEEVRDQVPRPPLPEVDRLRGRIGFDYSSIQSAGSVVSNNSQMGLVARADFTRIGGTYWNLSGYWRGRLTKTSVTEQPTLQDLINRTYHLEMSYSNPTSPWVAGFGRLYLPWASSLDTIDGGYAGRREGKHVLVGLFAGSTPDPTSWDYNPDRRIGGVFLNLEGGSFDSLRVSSTSGIALSTLLWQVDRPFIFFEESLSYKRFLSIYDSTQADDPRPMPGLTAPGKGLSRNFVTARLQPHERISFDVNYNYFRDVPTFSTALIATGLLDQYLFQGLSAGARVEPIRHITFYTSVGKSSRTGDTSSSWNEMYGVTLGQIWKTGVRADVRASKFNSSFGNGNYRSVSLSRNFTDVLRLEMQLGEQSLASQLTSQTNSRFVNATLDANLGRNYFLQGAYTVERGGTFNYDQWTVTLGYRFDTRSAGVSK